MSTRGSPAEGTLVPRAVSPRSSPQAWGVALGSLAVGCVQSRLILRPPGTSLPGSLSFPPPWLTLWAALPLTCVQGRLALCRPGLLAARGFAQPEPWKEPVWPSPQSPESLLAPASHRPLGGRASSALPFPQPRRGDAAVVRITQVNCAEPLSPGRAQLLVDSPPSSEAPVRTCKPRTCWPWPSAFSAAGAPRVARSGKASLRRPWCLPCRLSRSW